MNIVAVQNIGPMGPAEGKPLVYNWPIYVHAARLLMPLVLVMLLMRKPNRTRDAWLVLLPALAIPVLVGWVTEQVGGNGIAGLVEDAMAMFLFALAFLWLLAYRLENLPRTTILARVISIFLAAGVIGLIGVSYLGLDVMLVPKAFVCMVLIGAFLAVMALTFYKSRKRYGPLRFLVRLFIIVVVGGATVVTGFAVLLWALSRVLTGGSFNINQLISTLSGEIPASAIGSAAFFLVLFPFLALALWAPTYRRRFHSIFRLPGMQPPDDSAYNGPLPELPVTGDRQTVEEPPDASD